MKIQIAAGNIIGRTGNTNPTIQLSTNPPPDSYRDHQFASQLPIRQFTNLPIYQFANSPIHQLTNPPIALSLHF